MPADIRSVTSSLQPNKQTMNDHKNSRLMSGVQTSGVTEGTRVPSPEMLFHVARLRALTDSDIRRPTHDHYVR